MLKQRVMTGAGLAFGIVAVLLLSEHYWFLKVIAVLLSLMATYELCRAGEYLKRKAFLFGTMAASIFSHYSAARNWQELSCYLLLWEQFI